MTAYDFVDWFANSDRKNQFSRAALFALFDWHEEMEQVTGKEIEFDPIAICCEWSEYASMEAVREDYPDIEDAEELREHTSVIEFDGGILVARF